MKSGSWKTWSSRGIFFVFSWVVIFPACRPVPEVAPPVITVQASPFARADPMDSISPSPQPAVKTNAAIHPPRLVSWTASGVSFEGVTYDSRSHRLRVVDQNDGPGSRFLTAAQAARSVGGIAAVNAGFFTPGGEPLGLVMSGGNATGHWNSASSIGSGVWHQTADGGARIVRRESLGAAAARRMPELLQSGPMLVDGGRPVQGLHGGAPRPRTLIAWDGRHRWWIGCAAPCTMPNLAAALAGGHGPGFSVHAALNLDGGRSSELWVGSDAAGGPITRRPPWNRTVRNHLVLVTR